VLAQETDVLLLDEPMAGLGPCETEAMTELIRGLRGGPAILLVEHDMDVVFALADRVSVLVYGRLLTTGTPDEVRADERVQAAYLREDE
jgi:branched-chain amino acid transport system ATP-binding protein